MLFLQDNYKLWFKIGEYERIYDTMDELITNTSFLWEPLLEATAQTIVGAVGAFALKQISSNFYAQNTFESPMDLWKRGIHNHSIEIGDRIKLECVISPYTQLFPCDPFENAKLWRNLYTFEGYRNTNGKESDNAEELGGRGGRLSIIGHDGFGLV